MDKSKTSRKRRKATTPEDMGSSCCKDSATGPPFTDTSALNKTETSPNKGVHSPTKKGKKYKYDEKTELKQKVFGLQRERDGHKEAAENANKQKDDAEKYNKSLVKQLKDVEGLKDKAEEKNKSLVKQLKDALGLKDAAEKKNESLDKQLKDLNRLKDESEERNRSLVKQLKDAEEESTKLENHAAALKKQLDTVNEQNSNLLNRISELAGAKLSAGNPNLVDISDENRPTKLAERYNELYDNDWTDAFDFLTRGDGDEAMAINKLRNIFMSLYNECREYTSKDLESFQLTVLKRFRYDENAAEATVLRKQYIDRRKKMYKVLKADVEENINTRLNTIIQLESERTSLKKFTDETFDVCMLMCLQDPLVVIESDEPGAKFDTNTYKAYTTSGKFVDYVVWPALRLHQGGPLLGKGIAQGRKTKDLKGKKTDTQARAVPERPQTSPPDYTLGNGAEVKPIINQHTGERSDKHTSRQTTGDANNAPSAQDGQHQFSNVTVLSTSGAKSTRKISGTSQKKQAPSHPQTDDGVTKPPASATGVKKSVIKVDRKGSKTTGTETTFSEKPKQSTYI